VDELRVPTGVVPSPARPDTRRLAWWGPIEGTEVNDAAGHEHGCPRVGHGVRRTPLPFLRGVDRLRGRGGDRGGALPRAAVRAAPRRRWVVPRPAAVRIDGVVPMLSPSAPGRRGLVERCLLTENGREYVALVGAVSADAWPSFSDLLARRLGMPSGAPYPHRRAKQEALGDEQTRRRGLGWAERTTAADAGSTEG
jgi:hypothetical protein